MTRVLIVDDSALVRRILAEMLSSDPALEVVGAAADAFAAREMIKTLNPDVLTLDVEMPRMDGVTFLKNLMRLHPMPVVMVSSLTEYGAEVTLDALSVGAVEYLAKPRIDIAATLVEYRDELIAKVKAAARARVRRYQPPAANARTAVPSAAMFRTTDRIIAIGASTGGTEAIKEVLIELPADCPGVVIAQHIPKAFSLPFANRMDRSCGMTVCEAQDGQQIVPGHVYIAPGDRHLRVARDGARYLCRLEDGDPINRHKPSVDALFESVARNVGRNAVGVLLTGMGRDGAAGLKQVREAGGRTIAQDEATSVVWGMPGEAVQIGAAAEVLPIGAIARRVLAMVEDDEPARQADRTGGCRA